MAEGPRLKLVAYGDGMSKRGEPGDVASPALGLPEGEPDADGF